MTDLPRTLSVAPMMDYTDRHCRFFLRLISRHTLLYTEMIHANALIHGDTLRLLAHDPSEHPVAIQLGGSDPAALARSARMAEEAGYDEVNLNVGCPSDRVQSGRFGACLMAEPELVAECVAAMRATVDIPVTVKTRIGIDHRDSFEELCRFVETVSAAGGRSFVVHARKAWLKGLSPKQNRGIPPLRYDVVQRLKAAYPQLEVVVNGGITDLNQAHQFLDHLDGAMIGREAYRNPYLLATADREFYADDHPVPARHQVLERFMPYARDQTAAGTPLNHLTRHILGLFQGVPGARSWRRHLSEHATRPGAGPEIILEAADFIQTTRAA